MQLAAILPRHWATVWLLAFCIAPRSAAEEPRLLAVEPAGLVPVTSESRVVVRGLAGEISLRAGKSGELRFLGTAPGTRDPLPLAVSLRGDSYFIEPPPESADTPRSVQIAVPAGMAVLVELSGAAIEASGLRDRLQVEGSDLDLDLRGLGGAVELDLEGGRLRGMSLDGDLTLEGREIHAELRRVMGSVEATVAGSALTLDEVGGAFDADLDGGALSVRGVGGAVHLVAHGARVELAGLQSGAELRLDASPLVLRESKGELNVETDADVTFHDMEASLHFNSYGGSLRGSGNQGLLEVKTDGAEISIEKVNGPMRIEGDRLNVGLKHVAGELLVYTSASTVAIVGASGDVSVENEFGDVTVHGATKRVRVRSRDGNIRMLDLSGSVEVEGAGPAIEVSWVSMTGAGDSTIHNASGDVTVRLPPRGGCRVDAESRFGRVETDLPGLRVSDDGNSASGVVGRAPQGMVRVRAEGDVYLKGGAAAGQAED